MEEFANLAGRAFHDHIAEGNLTVAADGNLIAAPYRQNGRAVKLFRDAFAKNSGKRRRISLVVFSGFARNDRQLAFCADEFQ